MAKVKEAGAEAIRSAFEPGRNGCRIEKAEKALREAGFSVKGHEETEEVAVALGFSVGDSYVWEDS